MLYQLEDVTPLNFFIHPDKTMASLTEFTSNWKRYNSRKVINRLGLSVTSLDGSMNGVPDLDSLNEFFFETGVHHKESDFATPTPVFHKCEEIHGLFRHFSPIGRSHFIKLNSGGFFPPHRDAISTQPSCFRVFVPLYNCRENNFKFLLDDRVLKFEIGRPYYICTSKVHSVFSFVDNCIFLVMNVPITNENLERLFSCLLVR